MADIRSLRHGELGRSAFILGNGPSILGHDLTRLRGQLVIGMNASPALDRRFGFTSRYYCLSDMRFLDHPEKRAFATAMLEPASVRVVRSDLRPHDDAGLAAQTCYVRALGRDGFSGNLAAGYYFGCTTTMLAIQVAAWLGCRAIHLLGVDLVYRSEQPRFYEERAPQPEDSFLSVQVWNIANARQALEQRGVEVRLCSPRSLLRPYVPFVPFEEVALDQPADAAPEVLQANAAA